MNGADIHSLHDFLNTDCLVIELIFKITNWQSQNDFSWPVSFASWRGGGGGRRISMVAAKCPLPHLHTEALRTQATTNCFCFDDILNLGPISKTVVHIE